MRIDGVERRLGFGDVCRVARDLVHLAQAGQDHALVVRPGVLDPASQSAPRQCTCEEGTSRWCAHLAVVLARRRVQAVVPETLRVAHAGPLN